MSTWGPTLIAGDAAEGYQDGGNWSTGDPSLPVGSYDGTLLVAAFAFPLPAIAASATINKCYLKCRTRTAAAGTPNVKLGVEISDTPQTFYSSGKLPTNQTYSFSAATGAQSYGNGTVCYGEGETYAVNLATQLQALLTAHGDIANGEAVNFVVYGVNVTGTNWVPMFDYAEGVENSYQASLYLDWTEGGGATPIPVLMHHYKQQGMS